MYEEGAVKWPNLVTYGGIFGRLYCQVSLRSGNAYLNFRGTSVAVHMYPGFSGSLIDDETLLGLMYGCTMYRTTCLRVVGYCEERLDRKEEAEGCKELAHKLWSIFGPCE